MVTFDPLSLLPPEELVRPRSPKQLRAWVLDRCDAIANVPEAKQSALLHLGPFKRFYEEVYPLSLFAVRRYGEQDDVVCVPNKDEGRDFDAEVRTASRGVKVEITLAPDPLWHLRMEYFMKHGFVPFNGPVSVEGSRRKGRRIATEMMLVDSLEEVALHLRRVKEAAEGKAVPGRYGAGYELLIVVEDSWFEVERDSAHVAEFLEREVMTLPLCFDALHLVGWTNRLYQSVTLRR